MQANEFHLVEGSVSKVKGSMLFTDLMLPDNYQNFSDRRRGSL